MLKIKRKPFGHIRDMIVGTPMVQNCTCGDSGRHNAVACRWEDVRAKISMSQTARICGSEKTATHHFYERYSAIVVETHLRYKISSDVWN